MPAVTPNADQSPHRYSVHARHQHRHHARIVEETSFEAAAVAYAETLAEAADDGGDISLIVRDLADGREHCFTIDLDTGEADPCG